MNEWGKITWTTGIAPSRKQVARPKIWGKIPDALAGQKKYNANNGQSTSAVVLTKHECTRILSL